MKIGAFLVFYSDREPVAHFAVAIPVRWNLQEITDASAFMTYGRLRSRAVPLINGLACEPIPRHQKKRLRETSFLRFSVYNSLQMLVVLRLTFAKLYRHNFPLCL